MLVKSIFGWEKNSVLSNEACSEECWPLRWKSDDLTVGFSKRVSASLETRIVFSVVIQFLILIWKHALTLEADTKQGSVLPYVVFFVRRQCWALLRFFHNNICSRSNSFTIKSEKRNKVLLVYSFQRWAVKLHSFLLLSIWRSKKFDLQNVVLCKPS